MMEDQTLSQAVFQRVRDLDGRILWLLKETFNYYWPGEPEVSEVDMVSTFDDLRRQGVDVVLYYEELEVVADSEDDTPPPYSPQPESPGRFGGPGRSGRPFRRT